MENFEELVQQFKGTLERELDPASSRARFGWDYFRPATCCFCGAPGLCSLAVGQCSHCSGTVLSHTVEGLDSQLIFSHCPQIMPTMPEFLVWVQYMLPSPYTTRPGVEPQSERPSGDFSIGGSTCLFLEGVFVQEHPNLSDRFTIVESQKRMGWVGSCLLCAQEVIWSQCKIS